MATMKVNDSGFDLEVTISELAKKQKLGIGDLNELEMIFTDSKGLTYSVEVILSKGWTVDDLQEIVKQSCLMCDNPVKKCVAVFRGKPLLN